MTQSSETPAVKMDTAAPEIVPQGRPITPEPAEKITAKKPTKKPSTPSSGKGLAVLALLVGLGGAGSSAWTVWQLQMAGDLTEKQAEQQQLQQQHQQQQQYNKQLQEQQQQQEQQLAGLRNQLADLTQREQQLSRTLAQLPSAAHILQGRDLAISVQAEQQLLSQRVETVLSASRKDWQLAEAEHLLRMASLRLSALHDTTSARFLLQAADQILMEQDDPATFAAREQLAKSIVTLKSYGNLDRTGLFVRLGALHQLASKVTHLAPEFIESQAQAAAAQPAESMLSEHWTQWLEQISRYVRIDFNAGEQVQALLGGQSLTQVRLALGLALEQAQWAALNGATEVYQQSLQQALNILAANFSPKDSNVSALKTQINELREQKVSQELPNLNAALKTLQAYISTRSNIKESNSEESN